MAYTLIETVEVGSGGASSINFTNIPQEAGADLVLRISSRSTNTGSTNAGWVKFNASATDPSAVVLASFTGGTPVSLSWQYTQRVNGAGSTANTFSSSSIYISNYASSATKTFSADNVTENNSTDSDLQLSAGTWGVTDAITSLEVISNGSPYVEHTTASLYLVTTADASGASTPSPKATGGSISFSGGYWYHAFTSSGTFAPTTTLSCEYIIVAGGASGGAYAGSYGGGGGGAGGFRSSIAGDASGGGSGAESAVSFTAGSYSVVVGAGGAQLASNPASTSPNGNNGSNSSLSLTGGSITSTGGGGGGSGPYNGGGTGNSGGSGGGGGGVSSSGAGTSGQGFAGGSSGSGQSGSPGGGAGAAGPTRSSSEGSFTGGAGLQTSISISPSAFAGGGTNGYYYGTPESASSALGGGGSTGSAGATNQGGGGSGGSFSNTTGPHVQVGSAGGSGIVIVRYAA